MGKRSEQRFLVETLRRLDHDRQPNWLQAYWPLLLSWATLLVGSFALFYVTPTIIGIPGLLTGFVTIGCVVGWACFRLQADRDWLVLKNHVDRESVAGRLRELET